MKGELSQMNRPLEGIRILELASYHAGPGGSAILADMGAEVIKVERPGIGDPIREVKKVGLIDMQMKGVNVWHEVANRGKRSITLDLTKKEGREAIYRLVSKSDIFLTNWRRPAIDRMGMTYPILSKINPRLIYARVSGYGPSGPDRDAGAYDPQGQARAGVMFTAGALGADPLLLRFAVIDQATAIMCGYQMVIALLIRERLGIAQEVNVSILSSALFLNYFNVIFGSAFDFEATGGQRSREYPTRNFYKCADARWLMITMHPVGTLSEWALFCQAIQHPELAQDERFDTNEKRRAQAEQLVALIDGIFATRSRDEWLKSLRAYDIPAAPIHRSIDLKEDLQILENGYLVDFDHPKLGRVKIPGFPIHFGDMQAGTRSAAPELGEHTEAVLGELGGYSKKEIEHLKNVGAT